MLTEESKNVLPAVHEAYAERLKFSHAVEENKAAFTLATGLNFDYGDFVRLIFREYQVKDVSHDWALNYCLFKAKGETEKIE